MEIFKNDLISWTENDIEINKLKSKINELNKDKKEKESGILKYISDNNLESQTFELPNYNYKLSYKNQKSVESYTLKYLKETLSKYFKEKDIIFDVDDCINFLKNNRGKTFTPTLKIN